MKIHKASRHRFVFASLGVGVAILTLSASCFAQPNTSVDHSNAKSMGKKIIVDPKSQSLDFTGLSLEGEVNAPGEFYFQNRNQERFDDLTKKRLNFHREMMRDSVQSQ